MIKGKALTNSSVILGLVYTRGGMDPSGFFAVAGTPVARNPNPANGAFVVSSCPVLTWIPGTGTVSESVYLSASFDDVNSLAGAAKLAVGSLGWLDVCTALMVAPGAVLRWSVDAGAVKHTVYLSTKMDDVVNGVGGITRTDPNYTPGGLQAGATYYGRMDESDGAATV